LFPRTALVELKVALRWVCNPEEKVAPWEGRKLLADDSSEEIALIVASYFLLTNLKRASKADSPFDCHQYGIQNILNQEKEEKF
jgi:hypothetical protein